MLGRRCGIDSMSRMVEETLSVNPFAGDVFVFVRNVLID